METYMTPIKSRSEQAAERKRSGRYNCAQAVACTYADVAGLDESVIAAATSAFGTGMGTMEGTCGAIVGAGVVAGMVINDRIRARETMKNIMLNFEKKNGATVCRRLKGIDTGCPLRDCNGCCADAASMLEQELNLTDGDIA